MDENSSISDLKGIEGLTVYDQDQFEERVSKNLSQYVEKQKREHDVKQLNGELKSVIENLGKAKENLSKVEKSLNDAVNRGITSDRRLKVFLEQQDKLRSEVEQLGLGFSSIVRQHKSIKLNPIQFRFHSLESLSTNGIGNYNLPTVEYCLKSFSNLKGHRCWNRRVSTTQLKA